MSANRYRFKVDWSCPGCARLGSVMVVLGTARYARVLCHDCGHAVDTRRYSQSTGRTDDDGHEIFEGDQVYYVYHVTHGPHEEGRGEVFWDDETAGFLVDRAGQWSLSELSSVKIRKGIKDAKA